MTWQYLSHDGRPAPRRASRRHRAARRRRTFANGKIPAARPGRHSVEFRLVRDQTTVADCVTGDVMGTTTHYDQKLMGAREVDGIDHVGNPTTARD